MKLMTHIAAMAVSFSLLSVCRSGVACAQTNPLWHEEKIKNYLPHMTSPEVRDLLRKTDMAARTERIQGRLIRAAAIALTLSVHGV